jgi:hypothetical protein
VKGANVRRDLRLRAYARLRIALPGATYRG